MQLIIHFYKGLLWELFVKLWRSPPIFSPSMPSSRPLLHSQGIRRPPYCNGGDTPSSYEKIQRVEMPACPSGCSLALEGTWGWCMVPFLTWNSSRKVVVPVVPNRENLVGNTLHTKNKTEIHKHTQRLEILH